MGRGVVTGRGVSSQSTASPCLEVGWLEWFYEACANPAVLNQVPSDAPESVVAWVNEESGWGSGPYRSLGGKCFTLQQKEEELTNRQKALAKGVRVRDGRLRLDQFLLQLYVNKNDPRREASPLRLDLVHARGHVIKIKRLPEVTPTYGSERRGTLTLASLGALADAYWIGAYCVVIFTNAKEATTRLSNFNLAYVLDTVNVVPLPDVKASALCASATATQGLLKDFISSPTFLALPEAKQEAIRNAAAKHGRLLPSLQELLENEP